MSTFSKAQRRRGVQEGPDIYFRRSQNLPNYSVISLKVETSFSQYQHFHLSKQQVSPIIMIDVFGRKKWMLFQVLFSYIELQILFEITLCLM